MNPDVTKRRTKVEHRVVRVDGSEPTPEPIRRPWMFPELKYPGSGSALPAGSVVRFGPDYLGDLPLWGIDWHKPRLHRDLLVALTEWQDEFDVQIVGARASFDRCTLD